MFGWLKEILKLIIVLITLPFTWIIAAIYALKKLWKWM